MAKLQPGNTRGILNPRTGARKFQLSRPAPSAGLAFFIEHYWIVKWDLRGQEPYVSETLPFPSVHVVIETGRAAVHGVVTGKFTRRLEGRGRAFGIKFRPGTFHPFFKAPLSTLTDREAGLRAVFGVGGVALRRAIDAETVDEHCVGLAESFLRERLPAEKPVIRDIRDVVEKIASDREIIRVEQVAALMGTGARSLQRAFGKYVGVSPKWVIRRYRLQEAAERLTAEKSCDVPALAVELGYFDQAHFIRDFKAVIGQSPGDYIKRLGKLDVYSRRER